MLASISEGAKFSLCNILILQMSEFSPGKKHQLYITDQNLYKNARFPCYKLVSDLTFLQADCQCIALC